MVANSGVDPVAVGDFVTFGLVLHVSNIHQVNVINDYDNKWKSVHNGVSSLFIVIYSLLMFTTITKIDTINYHSILKMSVILSVVSFMLSFSIFYRTNARAISADGGASP